MIHTSTRAWLLCLGLGLSLAMPSAANSQEFIRGDVDGNGYLSVIDALEGLEYLFLSRPVTCEAATDTNDDGTPNILDPLETLTYLFLGGEPPAAPFPSCGPDPTIDLSCEQESPACGLAGPVDGLTISEIQSFNRGRDLMLKRFKPSEGLGPLYNTTSCAACHDKPTTGGSAPTYRNFYLAQIGAPGSGQDDPPGLPSAVIPSFNGLDGERPLIPEAPFGPGAEPVRVSQRNAPPFFGTGLFELISDATIIANADPNDSDDDGISGRYNTDGEGNVGRFGYKLQANFIEAFIRGAALNQMGITTDAVEGADGIVSLALAQVAVSFDLPTTDDDGIPDPEMSVADLEDIVNFCKFVRPPRKKEFSADAEAGETLFEDIGCTSCHIPSLASSGGDVEAYTDLLLHDMGPDLADSIHMGVPQFSIFEGLTTENEFRTQPLWGASEHAPFLHDGRADTLATAIEMHGGEAEDARDAYLDLTDEEKNQLIEFLEAL